MPLSAVDRMEYAYYKFTKFGSRISVLGLASVCLNSDLIFQRPKEGIKIGDFELGRGIVSQRDIRHLGKAIICWYGTKMNAEFYKVCIDQKRPEIGRKNKFFDFPNTCKINTEGTGATYQSFPSRHAAKMFYGAGLVQKEFGFKVALPFYLCSAIAALERVYQDIHYVHDIIGGAFLGCKMALSDDIANWIPTPIQGGGVISYSVKY